VIFRKKIFTQSFVSYIDTICITPLDMTRNKIYRDRAFVILSSQIGRIIHSLGGKRSQREFVCLLACW